MEDKGGGNVDGNENVSDGRKTHMMAQRYQ